ncbi:MAG: hypothetical protein ACJAUH_002416 [Saprospiraceae bacterium]|jgi:hypothetical protein
MVFIGIGLSVLIQSCTATQPVTDSAKDKVAEQADLDFLYKGLKSGENLKLKKLIYYLDRPLVISGASNFTLDGSGSTFIMKNKSEDVVVVEFSENVVLKNFKATHIEPEGPIGCTGSVIQVRESSEISIEKCELNGSGIIGVVAYNTKSLSVIDNYIYNNSSYGVLYDTECSIEIKGNKFEDNGDSGNDHVAKALNGSLSKVEKIQKDTNKEGLKMSNNIYK